MARQGVKDVTFDESQQSYLVTYCDDTTAYLPIPCTCDDGTDKPDIPDNGQTRCRKIGKMTKAFQDLADLFLEATCPHMFPPDGPALAGAIMNFMLVNHLPAGMLPGLIALTSLPGLINADTCVLFGSEIYLPLANIMDCCWNTTQTIDTDFINCMVVNLQSGGVYDAQTTGFQKYMVFMAKFMQVVPFPTLYQMFFDAVSNPLAYDAVNCEDFIPCDNQEGCLPDALYQVRYFRWDDVLMEGGSNDCYGAGVFTPCAPYNSRLVADEISIQFTEQICIKEIYVTLAGNSACVWNDIDYLADMAIIGHSDNIAQKTKCVEGSAYSAGLVLTTPIECNRITIKPTRTSGSNPSAGQHVHCIRLNYAYLSA